MCHPVLGILGWMPKNTSWTDNFRRHNFILHSFCTSDHTKVFQIFLFIYLSTRKICEIQDFLYTDFSESFGASVLTFNVELIVLIAWSSGHSLSFEMIIDLFPINLVKNKFIIHLINSSGVENVHSVNVWDLLRIFILIFSSVSFDQFKISLFTGVLKWVTKLIRLPPID